MTFSLMLKASRANFLPASIIPFLIGFSLAFNQGYKISFLKLVLGVLGIASAHLAGNLLNDYCDHRMNADELNKNSSPFFGGSRVIQNGDIQAKEILNLSFFFFFFAFLCGTGIFILTPNPVYLIMMITGGLMTAGYTLPPLKFAYRLLGELVIFLLFGTFLVIASFYLFSNKITFDSFLVSLPISFLILGVILCNEIPDHDSDILAEKRNLISLAGKNNGYFLYILAVTLSLVFLIINIYMKILPVYALVCIFIFPISIKAVNILKNKKSTLSDYIKSSQTTIMLHSLVGTCLISILLISK